MIKKISNTVMLILLIAAVYIYYIETKPIKVTAPALAQAYKINKVEADNKYFNKEIELTGKVKAFYKLLNALFVLELQNNNEEINIFCFFIKKEDETKASHLKENDPVKITGKCVGMDKYKFVKGVKIEVETIKLLQSK